MPCKEAQIISNWSLEHDHEFTVLQNPQSPDPSPKRQHWDLIKWDLNITDVQLKNKQQLCDTIVSTWTKVSDKFFHNLVESMPWPTEAVKPSTSMVHLTKW